MLSAIILLLAVLTAGSIIGIFILAMVALDNGDEISSHMPTTSDMGDRRRSLYSPAHRTGHDG